MIERVKGMIFLFGAFTLAGTSVISARFVSGKMGTFTITAVSLTFALIFLVPLTGRRMKETIRHISVREWIYLICQALFGIFLFRMFLLFGLLNTSSAEAGILTGATPALTAILSRLILKERLHIKKILGIFSTIVGILFIQGLFVSGSHFTSLHIWGNILVICASICESIFNTCSRFSVVKNQLIEKKSIPPIMQTVLVSSIALLLCIIPACFEQPVNILLTAGLQAWLALIWYGVFITALAFIFWYSGIKRCNASTAAAFSGMMPFTSLILSVIILGEPAVLQQWGGGIMIILGMILIG